MLRPLVLICLCASAHAVTITQLDSPDQIDSGTTINFDSLHGARINFEPLSFANQAATNTGVRFSIGGGSIVVFDWTSLGRVTSSPNNAMVAVSSHGGTASGYVDLLFSTPVMDVGAFIGNDQHVGLERFDLEAFGQSSQSLGTASLAPNLNTSIDQFLGISSDMPISRARFTNVQASLFLSIALDDVVFTPIPEPSISLLAVLGILGLLGFRCRRR